MKPPHPPELPPGYDDLLETNLRPWFEKNYSMSFANYPVSDLYLSRGSRVVGC